MIAHHTAVNRVTFWAKLDKTTFVDDTEFTALVDMDDAIELAYHTLLIGLMEKPEIVVGIVNSVLDHHQELDRLDA